ncbi:MAG TPA: cysteine desulfurase-like protein [Candidatus Angelobacter sp.]|jgi:cysteine desulfurase family protein (TIGR01976 family)|nr:cysteine desulfurase-like protein [Candidatus Angelobacter sp.]
MVSTLHTHDALIADLDTSWVRSQFPSLQQKVNGHPAIFFDGPAGTQVSQQVIDAITDYLLHSNANNCGAFATSKRTDEIIAQARSAMADFLNCSSKEITFGPNMTTLTFAFSRGIGRDLKPGDEIVVTLLDHDANFAPWLALEELGVIVRKVDIHEADCTLNMEDLRSKINSRTRLVAVGYAANAVGTLNDVREVVRLAHEVGALAFIDAVHYAPHGPIDVRELDCDFLACSTYKFFGPHIGVMYGKADLLKHFHPYKVRPQYDSLPDRWETGTQNHECLAGVTAAVDYLAALGRRVAAGVPDRRSAVLAAYAAIQKHERTLIARLISGLLAIPGLKFYGISDPARFDHRVPTVAIRMDGFSPLQLAQYLGEQGIFTWDGNYFAINLTERLGVEKHGGLLRIGIVHYNTAEEVDTLLRALRKLRD